MPIALFLFLTFNFNFLFGQTVWKQGSSCLYLEPMTDNIAIGVKKATAALHIHREINFATDPYSVIRLSIDDVKSETHVWDIGNFDNLNFKFGIDDNTNTIMSLTQNGQLLLGTESSASSALMQLESTDRGLLLPRLTTAQKEAITSPASGLLVYDTDLQAFSYYDNGVWNEIIIQTTLNDYLKITDFNNSPAGSITNTDKTNWNTAYAWGNHATAGYLTSYTETDPIYSANFDVSNATNGDLLQYNGTKFIRFTPNYLTSYTEIDPVFTAWDKTTGITITESQITDFGTYLTSYTETDPVFNAWDKDYADLINKPTLFDGQWNSLSGTPPNISTFANDANYITQADVNNLWIRGKENTILLNPTDNIGIGTNKPQKSIHILRQSNSFNSPEQLASLRLENTITGGDEVVTENVFNAWDFENENNNLKLKFGQNYDKPVNNTDTKFTFSKEGKLIANEYTNTNNDFSITAEGISSRTYKNKANNFNVSETGVVTAEKFIGDGSELINLNLPETYWYKDAENYYNLAYKGDIIIGDAGEGKDGGSEFIQIRPTSIPEDDWYIKANEDNNNSSFAIHKHGQSPGTFFIANNGNVGIGTTTPSTPIHIKSKDPDIMLEFAENSPNAMAEIRFQENSKNFSRIFWNKNTKDFIFENGGNVGIGISNPHAKLDVNGAIKTKDIITGYTTDQDYDYIRLKNGAGDNFAGFMYNKKDNYYGGTNDFTIFTYGNRNLNLTTGGGGVIVNADMKLSKRGQTLKFSAANGGAPTGSGEGVEIGSSTGLITFWHTGVGYNKLACKALWANNEVVVKGSDPWPDYVFKDNYNLMPLNKLKIYISKNGHLPSMPTGEDVKKEGIKLAKNQTLMLQKIEELTLYIIELNKRIGKLEEENVVLDK